jgi:hypothetical protein
LTDSLSGRRIAESRTAARSTKYFQTFVPPMALPGIFSHPDTVHQTASWTKRVPLKTWTSCGRSFHSIPTTYRLKLSTTFGKCLAERFRCCRDRPAERPLSRLASAHEHIASQKEKLFQPGGLDSRNGLSQRHFVRFGLGLSEMVYSCLNSSQMVHDSNSASDSDEEDCEKHRCVDHIRLVYHIKTVASVGQSTEVSVISCAPVCMNKEERAKIALVDKCLNGLVLPAAMADAPLSGRVSSRDLRSGRNREGPPMIRKRNFSQCV